MLRILSFLATLAIVAGVGLSIYGVTQWRASTQLQAGSLAQYDSLTLGAAGRTSTDGFIPVAGASSSSAGWPAGAQREMAAGAMLIVAGALERRRSLA